MTERVGVRHDAGVVARLRKLLTAAISDALDRDGIPGALQGIAPLSNDFRAVGPAFTVRYAPVDSTGGTVGDFLDDGLPGAVIVIDNDGRQDVTVWGGIMTEVASVRDVEGTVINGVCRDVSASLSQGYPLFSHGRFMRTGKDRVRLVSVGEALTVSGVEIRPGTIMCADADGVVAVPEAAAERVADEAERIEQVESEIVSTVRARSGLREAREKLGLSQSPAAAIMTHPSRLHRPGTGSLREVPAIRQTGTKTLCLFSGAQLDPDAAVG